MIRLPAPRTPGRYSIGLVCMGNICRSPMAHAVLLQRVDEAGFSARVTVASGGTDSWHVGEEMDQRASSALAGEGYDLSEHRAAQVDRAWCAEHDLVLAMDAGNLRDLGGATERQRLYRDFDPVGRGADVPDPYYGGQGGFTEVLAITERTSAALVSALQRDAGRWWAAT